MASKAFTYESNAKEIARALKQLGVRDVAFKMRFPLKRASVYGRDAARKRVGKSFDVKSGQTEKWLTWGIKSSSKVGKDLEAGIWVHDPNSKKSRGFLAQQETGGTFGSRWPNGRIAIPTSAVPRTKVKGVISKRNKPRSLKRARNFRRGNVWFVRSGKRVRNTNPNGKKRMVVDRRIWYVMKKKVRKRPIFHYYREIQMEVNKRLPRELLNELQQTYDRAIAKASKKVGLVK